MCGQDTSSWETRGVGENQLCIVKIQTANFIYDQRGVNKRHQVTSYWRPVGDKKDESCHKKS